MNLLRLLVKIQRFTPTVALLFACSASPAFADNSSTYYAAIDLGSAAYTNTSTTLSANGIAFQNPGAVSISGGYNVSSNYAVEAGYAKFGHSLINSTYGAGLTSSETLDASSLYVAAVGSYHINEIFSLFGKLGLGYNRLSYGYSSNYGFSRASSGNNANLMYGIGAQYNISKSFGIRAQYENLGNINTTSGQNIEMSMASIGIAYTF